jgi:chemotaxis protein MotB
MALARSRRDVGINYWPGFVDALSTLVLGVIFLLTIFVVVQFFLSQEVAGKDTALTRLNKLVASLTDELALEKSSKVSLEDEITSLRASLAGAENERNRLQNEAQQAGVASGAASAAQNKANELSGALDSQKQISARALAQVEVLGQQIEALRRQLAAVQAALDASEKNGQAAQEKIADLGQRLNVALAQRVQELSRYRSDFFGRLRPEGKVEIDKIAAVLVDLEKQIPSDIAWVLRVDGHTDVRPIASAQFPSNWALSSARAISVVQYLISKGISPQHLVAAGFGEFQPLDPGNTEEAYRKNRRIELKLTER